MGKCTIFKNIDIVTPSNRGVEYFKNHNVAVKDEKIIYVGNSFSEAKKTLNLQDNNVDIYDGNKKILLPSFANAHTHLAMTLLRNSADDTLLHDWLFDHIFPVEARLRPQDLKSGTVLGIAEMIKNGTSACANMYMNEEGAVDAQLAVDAGININTVFNGGMKNKITGKFEINEVYFDSFFNKYNNLNDGMVNAGILVHSIYLYNEEYYYEIAKLAKSRNTFIHVHISETQREIDECLSKYKMRPPAILEKMGILDITTIAAHCVYFNDEDIEILKRNNVSVAHNPTSNLKLGSGFADINKMIESGLNVCLGTDGPASNNNLDVYQEMKLASLMAKGLNKDATVLSSEQILRTATLNGMKALGFNNSGEIAVGMDADLQILDTNNPSMQPMGNPINAIVYSANGHLVESLMVRGKMLMRKRELLTIDEQKAIFEANESRKYLYNL